VLVSEEECHHTVRRGAYYAIAAMLPELRQAEEAITPLGAELSSADTIVPLPEVKALLEKHSLLVGQVADEGEELLR
jgi:hypothetical protein